MESAMTCHLSSSAWRQWTKKHHLNGEGVTGKIRLPTNSSFDVQTARNPGISGKRDLRPVAFVWSFTIILPIRMAIWGFFFRILSTFRDTKSWVGGTLSTLVAHLGICKLKFAICFECSLYQGSQRITLLKFDMDISVMTSWRTFLYYELLQQKKRATKNDFKQGNVLYMVLSKIKHD